MPNLGFHGLSESPNLASQTLKLQGNLQGIPIQVLVDSDASHNFIPSKLISKLGLATHCFSRLTIKFGDSHRVSVKEQCHGLVRS